ncbi:MAG: Ig-like domain-containing protein, partial [Candidatus Cloacimonetes bacterium]|nr:Ig-like domain-containing protein [Candidatus Cloacimonadota bacterium]
LFVPGATQNWTFTATNASPDSDWMQYVIIQFPAGVTVNSATNFVGGTGGEMVPDVTTGTGVTITWFGETANGYGVIYGNGNFATATVSVSVPAGYDSPMNIPYTLTGDNYGAEPHTLNGSITLEADAPPVTWISASPLSGTIAAGANQTITGSFSAVGMVAGEYEALLSISSNDPTNPLETVQVLMEVAAGNRPPQITLPASFTFEKNGSLIQSFSSYISDPDGDNLILSVTGNSNVTVDISGNSVTFGAAQNWVGTETITFTVFDGELYDHASVDIIVTPTNIPEWEPVEYPTNPATVYAVVTIDGIPAQLNDIVAAFVGNECRGTGEIVLIRRSVAYTTLVVNLATSGETVNFKIYSHSADAIYPVPEEMPMVTGAVYGETEPVPLNGTLEAVIAAPTVQMISTISGARISWNAVSNANNYKVYSCSEPYGTYTLAGSTSALYWDINSGNTKMFYKVVAEQTNPAKGTK